MLQELIKTVIQKLVDQPNEVIITEVLANNNPVLQIKVAASDLGRVIGSEGRTFRALRALVHILGAEQYKDLVIDIEE
jgi:uncharacterized protein